MKNWLKIILILIVLGAAVGGGVAYFMFNKPHQDVIDTKPAFEYTANTLVSELAKDTAAFNLKTNGQVIQVSGPVRVVTLTMLVARRCYLKQANMDWTILDCKLTVPTWMVYLPCLPAK